jgi:hypothetical protein
VRYFIGDLGVFRETMAIPIETHNNVDNSSELAAYSLDQFPIQFILKLYDRGI